MPEYHLEVSVTEKCNLGCPYCYIANQDKLTLNRNEIWNTDDLNSMKRKMEGDWDWLRFRLWQ